MKKSEIVVYVVIILVVIGLWILVDLPIFLRDTAYVREYWLK